MFPAYSHCALIPDSNLTHNKMRAIKLQTFKGLESLQYLFVDHNLVSYIEDGALRELPRLQVL